MLYLDAMTEVSSFLRACADEIYYDFAQVPVVVGATYLIGREQLRLNGDKVRNISNRCQIVIVNPAEGSETLVWHLRRYGVEDLVLSGQIKLVSGGRMPSEYGCMVFEHFLTQPFRYEENLTAVQRTSEIFLNHNKPYSFLFLNGRSRPHRCAIINRLEELGLLQQALWTNLDDHLRPIQLLPPYYEVERYQSNHVQNGFVKSQLFNNEWGEIYIKPEPYIDTYFSLITETVYQYNYSFFTEKIAKPLCIGHPFIAVANAGFYQDLRNLGFKTFDGLIDESFDTIENPQDRMNGIVDAVSDLCAQDLNAFISAAEPICKYNQHHLRQFAQEHVEQLPSKFLQYIDASR